MIDQEQKVAIEAKRNELRAKRAANRRAAEQALVAGELPWLDKEIAYEDARARAYAEYGPERVLGGEIKGAGFAVLRWPSPIDWRYFVNKGILKKDKLTDELCEELVLRCLCDPTRDEYREMVRRNPNVNVALATKIIDAMTGEEEAAGKG